MVINNLYPFIFVLVRITGMIAFNPVFARRNIPVLARTAFVLALTFVLLPVAKVDLPDAIGTLTLILMLLQELFIGAVCAMVFLIFYYMIFFAGDFMDMQMGLSMARVFDPATNIQASISGNFFNVLFMLYFFATGSHLVLIEAFAASFTLVPAGSFAFSGDIGSFLVTLFASVFSLALRLALPFVAVEFVLEMSMGVLMKLIPQIHIFVINFQIKILMGILMLMFFAQPIGDFLSSYMESLLHSIEKALLILGG